MGTERGDSEESEKEDEQEEGEEEENQDATCEDEEEGEDEDQEEDEQEEEEKQDEKEKQEDEDFRGSMKIPDDWPHDRLPHPDEAETLEYRQDTQQQLSPSPQKPDPVLTSQHLERKGAKDLEGDKKQVTTRNLKSQKLEEAQEAEGEAEERRR